MEATKRTMSLKYLNLYTDKIDKEEKNNFVWGCYYDTKDEALIKDGYFSNSIICKNIFKAKLVDIID